MTDKPQTAEEQIEIQICNILAHADTIYAGMTFEEIRNSDLDPAAQKIVKSVDKLQALIAASNREARIDELKQIAWSSTVPDNVKDGLWNTYTSERMDKLKEQE